jgi:hypothetical protein
MSPNPAVVAPDPSEFAPYYGRYISLVKSDDIVRTLEIQIGITQLLLGSLSEVDAGFRYAPDKWSIRQILGHIMDAERIFSYRALRISRGDSTPIEGFEQDGYVTHAPFERCTMAELIEEFATVRRATVFLLRNLQPEAWTRRGIASDNEITVRALAYIIAGHEVHHMEMLRQKYLPALKASR